MHFATLFTVTLSLLLSATTTVYAQKQYSNTYMTCLVNKARQSAGLDPLGIDDALTQAAQQHSDDMARMNNMDHTGSDGSSPGDRCQRAGFNWSAVAENIAYGQTSMDEVMQVWMDSPGHRENILNPQYKMFGSAVSMSGSTPYYTQDFACDDKPARNIPTCDGDYPDMSTPGQTSGAAPSGSRKKSRQGGNQQPANGGDYSTGGSSGGKRKPRYSNGGRSSGNGRGRGSGDMFSDDDWFASQGFGQNPMRHSRQRGGDSGMFGPRGGFGNGNAGGFGPGFGGGFDRMPMGGFY